MKTALKVLLIIGAIILILIDIIAIYVYKNIEENGLFSGETADYEKRINIWKTVPGNTNESKLKDMNIDYENNALISTVVFMESIIGNKFRDKESDIDTFTYFYEIKGGFEKETYEDEPYLIPYLVDNSDMAVIVIPGGGFGYKSMDGTNGEGKDVAETLNKNGINAFVLHYRSNPYEYPIPYLDLQRAIRFLKYHKNDYHLDENKISVIGYSAGGNLVGTYINEIMGTDALGEDYTKDEIDDIDDKINIAAMIYPVLSFNDNIPMLFSIFDATDVRNETKRNELLEKMDLIENFNSSNIKQFIAYADKDLIVGTKETPRYIEKARQHNTDITDVLAKNQGHAFSQKYYIDQYIKWFKENI